MFLVTVFVTMHFMVEILLLFRAEWLLTSRGGQQFDLEIKLRFTGGSVCVGVTLPEHTCLLGAWGHPGVVSQARGTRQAVMLSLSLCRRPHQSCITSFSFIISCFYLTVLLVYIFFVFASS